MDEEYLEFNRIDDHLKGLTIMRRHGQLFESIVSFNNLNQAARRALRGQKRMLAARFYFHLETELIRLEDELRDGEYQPRPYRVFEIYEPKRREIAAADIRDRVLHHAICHILEPIFERRAIFDSYACRKGKGAQAAALRVQRMIAGRTWFLKCDIRQYFPSIDHRLLKSLLQRIIKDRELLALLDLIIDAPLAGRDPGKGLPIGNLTSQHFANLYLGELDHFIKERLRVKRYVRYMDDFLLFDEDRDRLRDHHRAIREFLDAKLALALKDRATIIAPAASGVPYLGLRIFARRIGLQHCKWYRLSARIRQMERAFLAGELAEEHLVRSVMSLLGQIEFTDTLEARRRLLAGSPCASY